SRGLLTVFSRDWSSDVCSSDLGRAQRLTALEVPGRERLIERVPVRLRVLERSLERDEDVVVHARALVPFAREEGIDHPELVGVELPEEQAWLLVRGKRFPLLGEQVQALDHRLRAR